MEAPEPSMMGDRSPRGASFFTSKARDGAQLITTFTESLIKSAKPIDPYLPFSLVHVISLAQNFLLRTSIVLLVLSQILDSIVSKLYQLFSGGGIPSGSEHQDENQAAPASEGPKSAAASESSSPHSSAGTIDPDSTLPDSHTKLVADNAGNADHINQTPSKTSALLQDMDLSKPTDQQQKAPVVQPPGHSDHPFASDDFGSALPKEDNGDAGGAEPHPEPPTQQGNPKHSTPSPSYSTPRPESTKTPDSSSSGKQTEESPETASYLIHLGLSGLGRYMEGSGPEELAESVQFLRQALNLQSTGHPSRPNALQALGFAVFLTHMQHRREADLSECLEIVDEIHSLQPSDDPDSSMSLGRVVSMGLMICDRCDPSEWSEMLKNAHTRFPVTRSGPSAALHALGSAIFGRYGSGGQPDLAEIIEVVRSASTSQPPSRPNRSANASTLPDRLRATLRWMDLAIEIDEKPELDAYRSAFTHLGSALALGQSLQARQTVLLPEDVPHRPAKGLPLEAALWALAGEGPKQAVELLDQGRNVLLASAGHFQIDLSDVRRQDPKLANEFHRVSGLFDSAILTGQGISDGGSSYEDPIHRYKKISADWEGVVTKIRRLRGCESFLLPVSYAKLQETASDGPVIIILADKHKSTAIIVTSDGEPHTVNLPDASEEALKKLHGDMEDALNNPAHTIHVMPSILSDLWTMLVQPIMQELKHTLRVPLGSRIWWYPTSWASLLPLHAAGSYKKGGLNAPDLYVSSYTPSLQALRQSRDRLNSSSIRTESTLVVSQAQSRLAGVDDEVGLVSKLVPDASLLSDDQKTKERVLNGLRDNSWIHLACRGVPHPSDPFQSYFALHDGSLSLQEIIAKDLPSGDFAYLSACRSAAQGRTLPDEDLTMAGGMQIAGFNGVVGTLWALADEDAPILAEAFYKGVAARSGVGMPFDCTKTAEALHDAVKGLREKDVPLFRWVSLVHYGI